MSEFQKERAGNPIPLGQRLFDKPFLLLAAGLIVMFGFYTLWGMYENYVDADGDSSVAQMYNNLYSLNVGGFHV